MSQQTKPQQEFGKIRSFIWPVHRSELIKLVPLLLMVFLIGFNYNVLRNVKDALVVAAAASGAEVIPFIKVWALLPMALLLTYVFTRLSNRFTREQTYYILTGIFLGFFLLFTFVLYPARDYLHPHELANKLEAYLPSGFRGLVAMFRYWTFTLFYAMAELWGTTVLFVLFWGFVNQISKLSEATRFYAILGLATNFAGIPAGQVSKWLSKIPFHAEWHFGFNSWEQTLTLITLLVSCCGFIMLFIFRWFNKTVLSRPEYQPDHPSNGGKKPKIRMSLRENFSYLAKSRYLVMIAVIVVAYNIVINLVEVIWKDQVKSLYPDPCDYNAYMGNVTTITGIIATLAAIFISGSTIRKFGWTFTAMISPVILLITSIGFFSFYFFRHELSTVVQALLGTTPLAIVVFFGSAQNCLSRASKYTLFDSTKELSFIPLSQECKMKGKAAIDGVGSRLGKSGGSIIHQGLLLTFTTIAAGAPYVAAILLGVISVWMIAVRKLGFQFNELVANHQKIAIQENKDAAHAETIVPEKKEEAEKLPSEV